MTTVIRTRRFTVDEFHRMAETGILKPDDRVELLDGEIISMAPMSSRHAAAVRAFTRCFQRVLADQAIVSVQSPVRLDDFSEPEPDVALLRFAANNYADAHPDAGDVCLLIEVGQSSLGFDREVKIPRYARAGVAEVWLVDLEAQQIELFRAVAPGGYETKTIARRGARIAPQAFPDAAVQVDELLA